MYILLDLEDLTDFEGQCFALRLYNENAGYISEDIAQALCELFEAFLTLLKYQPKSLQHNRSLGGPLNRKGERGFSAPSFARRLL
ncbi:unnamed protein product [Angiostrongylus costaricensis]|uniref:FERM domain-containing protein n=1 Tax=Angiostrongylus costaricensis TaxID=334426 RepID=A0A0R3PWR1_ANGCS|nr:unnamed protein product [Angiostrongylus costaricensis]